MLAAVNAGLAHGCRRFLLACGLGGRLDHSYANLCVLHHLHSLGYEAALYGDGEEACLIGEGETRGAFLRGQGQRFRFSLCMRRL